ncbi:MAG: hypothetical protein ACRC7U_04650 [Moraxella sp.]
MAALPKHIRQLVDKHNYVIAIKTHAQEQGISLEQAKQDIDRYEQSQLTDEPSGIDTPAATDSGFDNLKKGLDNHLAQEGITVPLIPRWVKRVAIIVMIALVIGLVFYRLIE